MASKNASHKLSLTKFPHFLFPLISLVGMSTGLYLLYIKVTSTTSFCSLSETISCDAVNASIYADIFGIPMSLIATGYFATVLLLTLFKRSANTYKLLFFMTIFSLFPSYYLTGVEIFILQAYCILCEFMKILMIVLLFFSYKQSGFKFKEAFRMAVPIMIAGAVASAIIFMAQSGGGTKEDYSPFVDNLNKKGVIMYRSFKCANCKRQEKLFGKAYSKLNAVECHPDGKNAEPERCLKMDISKTPTFLIEKEGKEEARLVGLQQLEKIAEWAQVPLEKAK